MTLTDKCLAIATATLLIYGMIFAGTPSPFSADEEHPALMHRQGQGDMTRHDSAQT